MTTYVIADPGSTHGGDLSTMKLLIEAAKASGADAIKLQWTSNARKIAERRNAWRYLPSYQLLQFPKEWLFVLKTMCNRFDIEFMATTYLCEDVAEVDPYVSRFKVASFEASDLEFLAQHVGRKRDVLVSTGMMDELALLFYLNRRERWQELKLLHCCSAYPAPLSDLNLGVIRKYALDGYSDHSGCFMAGAWAVACGARIVEAHLRLDDADPNCEDYHHSLAPDTFARYVKHIRLAEEVVGDGKKRAMPCEKPMEAHRVSHQAAPSH